MDKWEAKRRYVERKNRENEEIKSLTPLNRKYVES